MAKLAGKTGEARQPVHGKAYGSIGYVAPELLEKDCTYRTESDVYSLGKFIKKVLSYRKPETDTATRPVRSGQYHVI